MGLVNETKLPAARVLEDELWNAVENIGHGWFDEVCKRDEEGLRAYADGVKAVLIHGLERLQNRDDEEARRHDTWKWVLQLRAAVGEQLRRREPQGRCCKGRFLNEALCQVRDWRIALWDGDTTFLDAAPDRKRLTQHWDLRRKLDRWRMAEDRTEEDVALCESILNEVTALFDLYMRLGADSEWHSKRYQRAKAQQQTEVAA